MSDMRTIVEIPNEIIESLDRVGAQENRSRASLIREAVALYLHGKSSSPAESGAFGIWRERQENALDYQERLRGEWEDR